MNGEGEMQILKNDTRNKKSTEYYLLINSYSSHKTIIRKCSDEIIKRSKITNKMRNAKSFLLITKILSVTDYQPKIKQSRYA